MDFYNNRNLRRNYRRSKQRLPENLNNRICCVLYMLNVTFVVLVEIRYVLQRQKKRFYSNFSSQCYKMFPFAQIKYFVCFGCHSGQIYELFFTIFRHD